ncbi:MAG: prolyl oligopeptidase family serine peptidase [Roseovarius sp.]
MKALFLTRGLPLLTALSLWALLATMSLAQSPGPLDGKMFGSGNRALVVILHGDVSNGGPANYHYALAQRIAQANPGTSVFAMLRPGYTDGKGGKSPGSNNNRRDHYTQANNALVAKTIQNLARQTGASRVLGIGHSGGAAQLGAIAGMYPGVMNNVILAACPCNVPEWRASRGKSDWSNSLSPHSFAGKVPRGTRVFALVGTKDTNTRPALSEAYVAALKARGVPAQLVPVNGAGHNFGGLERSVEQLANQILR